MDGSGSKFFEAGRCKTLKTALAAGVLQRPAESATHYGQANKGYIGLTMPDEKSMGNTWKWNAEIDASLRAAGVVDQSFYLRLVEAYRHDAASTVGWVEAKMKVLLDRVQQGKDLSLFSPSLSEQKSVRSELDLRSWLAENFPGLSL